MKKFLILAAALAFVGVCQAKGNSGGGHSSGTHSSSSSTGSTGSHSVSGYTKSNGTYVAPTQATNPNSTKADNYSTKGNVNPYTGKEGTKSPN
ncbi:MAG: hypothetical protein V4505_05440 [Pseudomonadota bacterium]